MINGKCKRIFFVGYMGAGKTTFGRALAKDLNLDFYDLDSYISSRRHSLIPQIFEEKGADEFRKIERDLLHEVAWFENVVVSCGGGTPCFFDNIEFMNSQGETFYLKTSVEEILKHLQNTRTERPLLKGKSGKELEDFINAQLAEREPFYCKAKHIIDISDATSKDKIVDKLIEIKAML
ncbi:MAG: shikimate kinase [Prevotellaceae bacterium]|nr:shikimate kinase [Prevotellaceae bacterium]